MAFDPVYVMAAIALLAVWGKERSALFDLRWEPDRHTYAAIFGALIIFALSCVLATSAGLLIRQLILHVGLYALMGVWLPLYWVFRKERSGFEGLGITKKTLRLSLAINLMLGAFLSAVLIAEADWSRIAPGTFLAALFVLLTGNFFELIFYYGFVHLRLRKAFGPLPAIFGTSFLYVLWHTGTELMLVDHPLRAAAFLFVVGVLYQSVFALTRNLAIIFPFFVGAGVMLDFTVNIEALEAVAPFVGWSLIAWALFALGFAIFPFIARRQRRYMAQAGQTVRE